MKAGKLSRIFVRHLSKQTYCRYCVIGVILGMLLGSISGIISENVAASYSNFIGWEPPTGVAHSNYNDGVFISTFPYLDEDTYGHVSVINTNAHTGTNSFRSGGGNYGWFNLKYSSAEFITNIDFWFKCPYVGGWQYGGCTYFAFYNLSTYAGLVGYWNHAPFFGAGTPNTHHPYDYQQPLIAVWINASLTRVYTYGCTSLTTIYTDVTGSPPGHNIWKHLFINFTGSPGNVDYYVKGSNPTDAATFHLTSNNITRVLENRRIDLVSIEGGFSTGGYWYNDDWTYTITGEYPQGGGGICDMSNYSHKGSFSFDQLVSGNWFGTYTNFVKTNYKVPVTMIITGFDILVSSYMVNTMGCSATSFLLRVNGLDEGYANELIAFGSGYIVRWCGLSVPLSNETVLFVVEQSMRFDASYGYWYVYAGPLLTDLDGDGDSESKFDIVSEGYSGMLVIRDLACIFYYEGFEIFPEPSPYTYDNITVPKTSWLTYDEVPVAYFISNFEYTNIIQVWHNGTQITDITYPFPYTIPGGDFDGIRYYVPLHIGNYKFRLLRNSVQIKSVNITVTEKPDRGYALWSTPNPQYYNQKINIGYRYFNPAGNAGMLLLGSNPNMNSTTQAYRWWQLTSNSSGNISITQIGDWYIYMYYGSSGMYYRIYDLDIHQQMVLETQPDSIDVLYKSFTLSETNSYKCPQTIYGRHNWYGFNVRIYINDVFLADVGESIDFVVNKDITIANEYVVTLYVDTVNGSLLIASNSFTISDIASGGEPAAPSVDMWGGLFGEYKYVFAIGIIVMFLLMPMTVASKLGIELPMIANLGSAAIGLSFCTLSGLLPLYVIFLTAVVVVVGGIVVIFR